MKKLLAVSAFALTLGLPSLAKAEQEFKPLMHFAQINECHGDPRSYTNWQSFDCTWTSLEKAEILGKDHEGVLIRFEAKQYDGESHNADTGTPIRFLIDRNPVAVYCSKTNPTVFSFAHSGENSRPTWTSHKLHPDNPEWLAIQNTNQDIAIYFMACHATDIFKQKYTDGVLRLAIKLNYRTPGTLKDDSNVWYGYDSVKYFIEKR